MQLTQFSMGADPEFFVAKDGVPCSAHDLVPGTKDKPHPLNKGALQADGTAVEFNIEPAYSAKEFASNIQTVLNQVRAHIPAEYEFLFKSDVVYDKRYFDKVVPSDAKVLGCDPDMSAFTMQNNPAPAQLGTMRTAGGHLHIGWCKDADINCEMHRWDCRQMVMALEYSLKPLLRHLIPASRRTSMYGADGAMRVKPYGVEWRAPDNFWLNYPDLWPFIYEYTEEVFKALGRGVYSHQMDTTYSLHSYENYPRNARSLAERLSRMRSSCGFKRMTFPTLGG